MASAAAWLPLAVITDTAGGRSARALGLFRLPKKRTNATSTSSTTVRHPYPRDVVLSSQ